MELINVIISELFKRTFNIVRNNLVLIQPLLIFVLLLSLILAPLSMASSTNPATTVLIISVLAFYCAFIAGWFNMFHKSIEFYNRPVKSPEEKALNSLDLFKEFLPGVGQYFGKIAVGFIIYIILFFFIMNLAGLFGIKFFGQPHTETINEMLKMAATNGDIKAYWDKVPFADKMIFAKWELLIISTAGMFLYLSMFWIQAIISDGKNSFLAFIESIRTIIRNPLNTLAIFFSSWICFIIVSIFNTATMNIIIQFIGLIMMVLTIVYFTMMTFLYFEEYRKINSTGRADSDRQDGNSNTVSPAE